MIASRRSLCTIYNNLSARHSRIIILICYTFVCVCVVRVCLRVSTRNNIIGRNITLNVANHGKAGEWPGWRGGEGDGEKCSDGAVGRGDWGRMRERVRERALKNDGNPRRLRVDANLRRT